MVFVTGLLGVVAVLASIVLMFVILLQEPKGGGLAAALGGSGFDAIGANVGQVNRFTSWVAAVWIGSCLLLACVAKVGADVGASDTPAVTSPPDAPGGGDDPK